MTTTTDNKKAPVVAGAGGKGKSFPYKRKPIVPLRNHNFKPFGGLPSTVASLSK